MTLTLSTKHKTSNINITPQTHDTSKKRSWARRKQQLLFSWGTGVKGNESEQAWIALQGASASVKAERGLHYRLSALSKGELGWERRELRPTAVISFASSRTACQGLLISSKQSANRRQQNFEAHRSADPLLQTLFQAAEMVARRHIHTSGTKPVFSMVNLCPSHSYLNMSFFTLVFRMQSNTMVLCFLLGFRVPDLAVLSFLCFSDAWGLLVAGIQKFFISFSHTHHELSRLRAWSFSLCFLPFCPRRFPHLSLWESCCLSLRRFPKSQHALRWHLQLRSWNYIFHSVQMFHSIFVPEESELLHRKLKQAPVPRSQHGTVLHPQSKHASCWRAPEVHVEPCQSPRSTLNLPSFPRALHRLSLFFRFLLPSPPLDRVPWFFQSESIM